MLKEDVEKYQILRLVTGSHAYGLNSPTSDIDEKAIVIEPIDDVCGIGNPWDGKVYSQAGHEDFEVYGLRKYLRLALKGNPTVTEMLFIGGGKRDWRGNQLQALYPYIVSRQAGKAYLGYMEAQRKRLTGERGNAGHGNPRQELIDAHGFDTKFAMHMLRLGLQGVELLKSGRLELPIPEPYRSYLRGVREGLLSLDQCLAEERRLETELKGLLDTSPVQEFPQVEKVEQWMLDTYWGAWFDGRYGQVAYAQPAIKAIESGGQPVITRLFAPNAAGPSGVEHFGVVIGSEKKEE